MDLYIYLYLSIYLLSQYVHIYLAIYAISSYVSIYPSIYYAYGRLWRKNQPKASVVSGVKVQYTKGNISIYLRIDIKGKTSINQF